MPDVTPEAVTAAAAVHFRAMNDLIGRGRTQETEEHIARVMLEAAALADEQASQRRPTGMLELVWRDERGEEIARCPRLHPGTERIAIPLSAQHCDLILGDDDA